MYQWVRAGLKRCSIDMVLYPQHLVRLRLFPLALQVSIGRCGRVTSRYWRSGFLGLVKDENRRRLRRSLGG